MILDNDSAGLLGLIELQVMKFVGLEGKGSMVGGFIDWCLAKGDLWRGYEMVEYA